MVNTEYLKKVAQRKTLTPPDISPTEAGLTSGIAGIGGAAAGQVVGSIAGGVAIPGTYKEIFSPTRVETAITKIGKALPINS